MAIQMRRGLEIDFNPDKMKPGEWAVSLDSKYVRMCFAPGLCFRMATYESFEEDMQEIQNILTSVNSTKEAIDAIKLVIDEKATIVTEKTDQALQYADVATQKAQEATDASNSASESATNANAYATSARESADMASTKATESSQSASNANASSESASNSAATATLKANDANTSATNARNSADNAQSNATLSESYAKGGTGTREGEDTDNAKYYYEHAKAVSNVDIATTENAGIVKPDGTSVTVDPDGTIHAQTGTNINVLSDIGDVNIQNPQDKQALVYDSETQTWKNGQGSASSVISDAWSASTTYAVGQYCIYNNSLWKCLVQHNGQTPTEGTYWTKVSVASEIASVNSSMVNQNIYPYVVNQKVKIGKTSNGKIIYRKLMSYSLPLQTNVSLKEFSFPHGESIACPISVEMIDSEGSYIFPFWDTGFCGVSRFTGSHIKFVMSGNWSERTLLFWLTWII